MTEWNWTQVDFELGLGTTLHANTLRIFINYQFSTRNVNYSRDIYSNYHFQASYAMALKQFLNIADKYGYRVVVTLFDWLYWELLRSENFWTVRNYLNELIPQFSRDSKPNPYTDTKSFAHTRSHGLYAYHSCGRRCSCRHCRVPSVWEKKGNSPVNMVNRYRMRQG